jgi:hypothetical protein
MRLEHLYRVRFSYTEYWTAGDGQRFGLTEGTCEGAVRGRFRGANHPRQRPDGTVLPDFQGVIETDDGATIFFDYRGRARLVGEGDFRAVASATHLSDDDRYRRLNDLVCAVEGRYGPGEDEILLDVHELVWEPQAAAS